MATLTNLVTFNATNGANPRGTLIADANGDLFGTTENGGANNDGTVYEIARTATGYASATILVSFGGANGKSPEAGLFADANGDLFGTTGFGGANNDGTIFEVTNTGGTYATAPTTLTSFTGPFAAFSVAVLVADASGDLFGTAENTGPAGDGDVFELVRSAGAYATGIVELADFNGAASYSPFAGLVADAAGNLFGTTTNGHANYGDIFEIAKTSTGYAAPATLATFNFADGAGPQGALSMDAAGDLFGTTIGGGPNAGSAGGGTVFELVKTGGAYASTPVDLASFDSTDGAGPKGSVIMDAAGNLFGTTIIGGATNNGTVFELARTATGYSAPIDLVSFSPTSGYGPVTGLIADGSGNLFGTADVSGPGGHGTVFELTNTPFVPFAVTIGNTFGTQATTDAAGLAPFANVTVGTAVANAYTTATVTLSAAANGVLSNPGIGNLGQGGANYTVSGTAADIQAALRGLVFTPTDHEVPVGTSVTTGFTLAVSDAYGSASDAITSVVATALDTPPTITDTTASQMPTSTPDSQFPTITANIQPFAYTTLADPDAGATLSTTIALTQNGMASDAEGTLSGTGLTKTGVGTYTLGGSSVAAETTALQGLTFSIANPYAQDTIGVALTVSDGVGAPVTAASTLGIAANPGGSLVVTNSPETVTAYNDNVTTNATHDYATEVQAVLNGSTVIYDQSFNLPYSDPAVQASVMQAEAALANANAGSSMSVETASNLTALSSQTTTTQTGSSVPVQSINLTDTYGPAIIGPNTAVATFPLGYFDVLAGQTDVNVNSVYTTTISRNVATTSTDLLTQQYTISGSTADAYTIAGAQAAQPTNDATALLPFAALTIANPANAAGTATVTLSAANGTLSNLGAGTLSNNGLTYTVAGTPAALQAALQALVFTPTDHEVPPGSTATTQFTLALSDGVATASNATTSVVATALETAPVIGGVPSTEALTSQQTIQPFGSVTITEPDVGAVLSTTIVIFAPNTEGAVTDAVGTLSGAGLTKTGVGVYRLVANSPALEQAAIQALVFTPTIQGGTTSAELQVADGSHGGSAELVTNLTVAPGATDAYTIAGTQAAQPTNDVTAVTPFAGLTIANPANAAGTATVTLSAANGTLSNLGAGTLSNSGLTYTVAGTPAALQAALRALVFTPTEYEVAPGFTATTQFTVALSDGVATASNNTTSVVATALIGQPLVGGVQYSQAITDQQTLQPFASATVTDPDVVATESTTIELQVPLPGGVGAQDTDADGTLSGPGLTKTAAGLYTLPTGTPAAVQAALEAVVFTPTAHQVAPGQSVLTYFLVSVVDDRSDGTINTSMVTVTAAGTADAYTIAGVQAAQPTNDATAVAPFAALSIADPANAAGTATVTLSAANGTLSDLGGGMLGSGGLTYTVNGNPAVLQATLQGLVFTPTNHEVRPGQTVTTGFALTVSDAVATVSNTTTSVVATALPVGTPVVSSPSLTVAENGLATPIGIAAPTDPSFAASQLAIAVVSLPTDGTVSLAGGGTAVAAGQGLTAAQLTGLVFTPTPGQFGRSSAFTYTATDPEGNATTGTATLAIGPALGSPTASSPKLTVGENAAATAIRFTAPSDPNYAASQLVITAGALPTDGTVLLADGVTAVAANQVLTAAQLAGLLFKPRPGVFNTSSTFSYTVVDPSGNAAAGAATLAVGPALGTPVVSSPSVTVAENAAATPIRIAAPTDPNFTAAQLAIVVGAVPTDGTVLLADGVTAVIAGQALTSAQLTSLLFKPTPGQFNTLAPFTYTVTDPAGNASAGTVTLAIGPALGNPVVASPTLTAVENAAATAIGIALPTDPNYTAAQLTITAGALPTDGTVLLADGVTAVTTGQALTAAQLTGLLFRPAPGVFGASATFGYSVADPAGNAATGAATLAIGPALGSPVVFSPALTVIANAAATPIGIAAPTDPNYAAAQLAITAGALPSDGTVTLADGRTAVVAGQALTVAQLTSLLFTPAPGRSGASSTFTYTARDPAGNTATGTAALAIGISTNPFATLLLGSASATAVFTVSAATQPATGGTFSTLGGGSIGPDGATYSVTGTVAQVNAALAGAVLTVPPGAPAVTGVTATVTGATAGQLTDTSALASSLTAAAANETLQAGSGADTLTALGANDMLIGGAGKDVLTGSTAGSVLVGGTGSSTFFALGGTTVIVGKGPQDVIAATAGSPDVFTAPGGRAVVTLGAGASVVDGLGADTITAGSGSLLASLAANSTVFLGSGASTVLAGQGDVVVGGTGPTFVGMRGSGVVLTAGAGLTEFLGDTGSDTVTAGAGGSAILFAGKGGGSYSGGTAGNNIIVGGQQATTINGGGSGDALFAAGSAGTVIHAGAGNETLVGAASSGNDTFYAGPGNDLIGLGSGADTLYAGSGSSTVLGGAGKDVLAIVRGGAGGSLTLFGFKAGTDLVSLQGFGATEATTARTSAATTAATSTQPASTTITLSDNTRITFAGLGTLPTTLFG